VNCPRETIASRTIAFHLLKVTRRAFRAADFITPRDDGHMSEVVRQCAPITSTEGTKAATDHATECRGGEAR
jgi:hypothetical protein